MWTVIGAQTSASGKATDDAVIEIWAAPATLAYIRNYVAQTLGKS